MSIAEDLDPQRANQFCVLHCCSFSTWNTTSIDFSVATLSPIFRKKECVYRQRGSITQKFPKSSDILFFQAIGRGMKGLQGSSCYFSSKRGVRLKSALEVLAKWDTICFMIFVFPLALGQLLAHSVTDTLLFKMMIGKWKQGRKECCLGAAGDVKNSSTVSSLLLGCCLGFFS